MSADLRKRAEQILITLYAGLNDNILQQRINRPVDQAFKTFRYKADKPITLDIFHRIIGDFTQHIYTNGLKMSWKLSLVGPVAQAISLLEKYYQSDFAQGYIAARMDAQDTAQGGMDTVLQRMAESIKAAEQEIYIQALFTKHLALAKWQLRCMVAKIFLERYRELLPPALRKCVPAQIVDELPVLLQRYLTGDAALQQIYHSHK